MGGGRQSVPPSSFRGRRLHLWWRGTRLGGETILQVAYGSNFDRDAVAAVEFGARRANPHDPILPVLFVKILQNLVAYGGIAGDLGLADESRPICFTNPHQHRATTANSFGLPGSLLGLNENRVAVGARCKPHGRSLALSSVLAHGGDVHQLGFGERLLVTR